MRIPYLTRKSKFRIAVLVIAVVCMLVVLIATGCKQSEKAEVSEKEKICSVEFFDSENLFLLERIEHRFVADDEKAAVELYTSAQVASDGQMGWDSGDQWTLVVRQGEQEFLLYDEYVQYGEVQFWVSSLNTNKVESPETEDLDHHIYVMVTSGVGFTMYDYVWDGDEGCFQKSVLLNPENQWNTVHSNKYDSINGFRIDTEDIITTENKVQEIGDIKSNILDDYEKRAEAEAFILEVKAEALQKASSAGKALLYYDPDSLCAYVDDELTNQYIERQLIYDIDPQKDPKEARDLYLNHYYSVMFEYIAEYDPHQFSIVDGEEGLLRIKTEYFVIERDGVWEIYSNQSRGSTPVS